ncbi:hypothetical protein M3_0187 [Lysinibacillus phage vB_LfM_LysYB1]|nr:hypothetical protein M3_0187 [Lysinibacillus phage vB_LfM_LysYB1]WAB25301.1 hypothetical protein M5_0123 [Lysinibacillus phage vB_LfM_LysYB2]
MRLTTAAGVGVDVFELSSSTYLNTGKHNMSGEKGDYLLAHGNTLRLIDKELFEVLFNVNGEGAVELADHVVSVPVHPYASAAAQKAAEEEDEKDNTIVKRERKKPQLDIILTSNQRKDIINYCVEAKAYSEGRLKADVDQKIYSSMLDRELLERARVYHECLGPTGGE